MIREAGGAASLTAAPEQGQGCILASSCWKDQWESREAGILLVLRCARDAAHTGQAKARHVLASFPCFTSRHSLEAQRGCNILLVLVINR